MTANGTATARVPVDVYRDVALVLHRRHINLGGEDQFGHWWTVLGSGDSFGWWPKYPIGHPKNRRGEPPTEPDPLSAEPSVQERIQHAADTISFRAAKALHGAKNHMVVEVFRGVEGELNGVTSFGGSAKRYGGAANIDPHAAMGDAGDDQYQAVLHDCRTDAEIFSQIEAFATTYDGSWSWRVEWGQNCHSFQIGLIQRADLQWFKKL